jgi:hypothetical protein
LLLGGMQRLFLNVSPHALRKRLTAERLTPTPQAASSAVSSSNVMSGRAATNPRTNTSCSAKAKDFLPRAAGATDPVRWKRWTSLIAQLTLTANCAAAAVRVAPASTAATIRLRRSSE